MSTSGDTLVLPAPAKLNLFLHVVGRRDDGYHLLQTFFQLLDHGDTLHFTLADELSLDAPGCGIAQQDNLVMKAARALAEHGNTRLGAQIRLDKKLPEGGGLGGGSSDAATALLGLNHLWQLRLDIETLARIGLSLGADVPLFVRGHSAFAEGVGEQLTPVETPACDYLVIDLGVNVATARVFGDPQLTRNTPESTVATFLGTGSETRFHNDCEPVARALFPEIDAALNWLAQHAGNARMTGTGGCIFARLENRKQGEALLEELPGPWTGFVAGGRNLSPLHSELIRLRQEHEG